MRQSFVRVVLAGSLAVSLISSPSFAFAQGKAAPTQEQIAEARKRYDTGLKLYDDGNYEAARIEFERAYALAPSYRILYNIGLACKQVNDYVRALDNLERYLSEGGAEVAKDRKADVEKEIAELKRRIASVTIVTNVEGAEISVDDAPVGKSPLSKPVFVNPGVRKISASKAGRFPASRSVTIGAGEKPTVNLELGEPPPTQYVEKERNPWVIPTIVAWSATGAAAIATTVFGVLALDAKSDQENELNKFGSSREDLDAARDKTQTLSGATDVLWITTAVFGGVSIFFTIKTLTWSPSRTEGSPPPATAKKFDLRAGPGGFAAVGTF